ncbi:MAG TPA: type II toxin-antitoxin system VapC family toxin [Candidatus Eisenbacteria bacterium]|uniref:Ribonuclease VapC n=1 Tax=Eiseniibacteriota bacterium TaxID=2212470 RepID=A0A7V2ATS2_UNCEI|nr:type II toxin-antitoxin system VapC family toxin [Candidatus Eisenbacteria bacterium]
MNVVDSSGWLEYFADGPNADFFAPAVQDLGALIVPSLTIYEVFKTVCRQRGEGTALQAIAVMHQAAIVDLDSATAIDAARLSLEHKIPMADSIILATSMSHGAILWTQDSDFEKMAGIKYIKRRGPADET